MQNTLAKIVGAVRRLLRPKQTQDDVSIRLMEIETDRTNLKARIEQAKRNKKAWMQMWVELRELENEALRLGSK